MTLLNPNSPLHSLLFSNSQRANHVDRLLASPITIVLIRPSATAAKLAAHHMATPFAGRGFQRQQAYRSSEFQPAHAILREVFASLLIEALLHNIQQPRQSKGCKAQANHPGHSPSFDEQNHFYRDQQVPKAPVVAGGPTVESLQQGLAAMKAGLVPAKAQAITTLGDAFFAAAKPLHQARSLAESTGASYTPNATQVDEMNRAFKKLSLHIHPDKWAGQPEKRAQAEAVFKDMATLRDELNTASAP